MTHAVAAPASLAEAYAVCERMARSHYENFTVVSWFLPKRLRPSMHAVYAFCRHTDDLGDEAPGDRLALLEAWEQDFRRCMSGAPQHPVLIALQDTMRRHAMPAEPFLKLIEANRMDQRNARYPTYADVLRYCDHSANPVGRMVLSLFGYNDAARQGLSDATCTALQLANFWQDVKRDLALGRIYIPLEDFVKFGYTPEELAAGVVNQPYRDLLRFEVERAQALFRDGVGLAGMVHPALRIDLQLFTLGGMSVLDAIRAQGYDTLTRRPTVSRAKKLRLLAGAFAALGMQRVRGR